MGLLGGGSFPSWTACNRRTHTHTVESIEGDSVAICYYYYYYRKVPLMLLLILIMIWADVDSIRPREVRYAKRICCWSSKFEKMAGPHLPSGKIPGGRCIVVSSIHFADVAKLHLMGGGAKLNICTGNLLRFFKLKDRLLLSCSGNNNYYYYYYL